MARKDSLRQLQQRLAQRLHEADAAAASAAAPAWLAVQCGRQRLLLPLHEVGEIVNPAPPALALAHAQPWFEGVVNLRGHLHGVVDLAAFLEIPLQEPGATADQEEEEVRAAARASWRLVALNPALGLPCALRVPRLVGLRSAQQLQPLPADGAPRPAFAGALYRDDQGRTWQALHLAALVRDARFLHAARDG